MRSLLPEAETYRGPEGFKRAIEAWRETFNDFRIEIEEVIHAGEGMRALPNRAAALAALGLTA